MSHQASLSQGVQQQSNTPESSSATNDWLTPHVAPFNAERAPSQGENGRSGPEKGWTKYSHHDNRQLPVAQVMPNVPFTPPTRHRRVTPSPGDHVRRDERPRKLDLSGRPSFEGRRLSGGNGSLLQQRLPAEGMTVEPWDTRQDGYTVSDPHLNDTTSQHFAIPHMEETLNQSVMVADMTLKPCDKHKGGSPHRRRSSSVPPKGRNSLPRESEDTIPSNQLYSEDPMARLPIGSTPMAGDIANQQQQHRSSSTTMNYQSARKIQDLTSWQRTLNRLDKEESVLNQLKHLELSGPQQLPINQYSYSYDAIRDPGLLGRYEDPRLLAGGVTGTGNSAGTDVGNLGGLIEAKDRIIQEKNYQIERLKIDVNQLQEKTRELQVDDRRKLYTSSGDNSLDLLILKLQEKDYENFTLRHQLTQLTTSKEAEMEQLTRKLGQTEYEAKKSQEKEKEVQNLLKREIEKLSSQMKAKETAHEETKEKYKKMREKYDKLKVKVQSLEHYLKDLPTADDYAKSSEAISSLQRREDLLKQRITALESDLTESRNVRRTKELEVSTLEEKNTDLEFEIQSLKTELGKMQHALGAVDGTDPTSFKLCSRGEFDDIVKEKERLAEEVLQLKKVADSKHKQIRKLQAHHQDQVREMEGRLMQEEDTAVGLREEIKNKEVDIAKMRKTLKDLSEQNQDLLSLKMTLQEKIKKQEKVISSENFQLSWRVAKELSECTKELQTFVQVCLQTAEGSGPNMSMLLGVRSNSSMSVDERHPSETEEEARKRLLEELQEIRLNIDILRGHLSEKCAESVSNNCITQ